MRHVPSFPLNVRLTAFATLALSLATAAAAAPAPDAQAGRDYVEGRRYYSGDGVPQSYAQAARLFRSAALKGHGYAQYSLALIYDHGYGVPQDTVEAARWYRAAAAQGDTRAAQRLTMMGVDAPQPELAPVALGAAAPQTAPRLAEVHTPAPVPVMAEPTPVPVEGSVPVADSVVATSAPASAEQAPVAALSTEAPAASAAAVADPQTLSAYQAAARGGDASRSLDTLEQLRREGGLAALGVSEAEAAQELARLALLQNIPALAQAYLEQAAALGAPAARSALAQFSANPAAGPAIAGGLGNPELQRRLGG